MSELVHPNEEAPSVYTQMLSTGARIEREKKMAGCTRWFKGVDERIFRPFFIYNYSRKNVRAIDKLHENDARDAREEAKGPDEN